MSDIDLSILGISEHLPTDAEPTSDDLNSAFAQQVKTVVEQYQGTPVDTDTGEGGADILADAESGDESADTSLLSTGTDNATVSSTDAVVTSISDDEGDDSAEGDEDSPPDYLSIPLSDGTTFNLDVASATDLLRLAAWSQALPERTKYAFAAIESGQAVAIPASDYAAFIKWQESQASQPSIADQIEDLSPEAAARIRELEARVAAIPDSAQVAAQHEYEQRQANINTIVGPTLQTYQQQHNYTDAQMTALVQSTIDLQIIPRLTEASTLRAPNGQILRDADHAAVLTRALDMVAGGGYVSPAMPASSPVPSPASTLSPVTPPPTAPSSTLPTVNQRVATKKARASSLASAPSSATSLPRSTEPLSLPDMEAHVAAAIKDAMRNGG